MIKRVIAKSEIRVVKMSTAIAAAQDIRRRRLSSRAQVLMVLKPDTRSCSDEAIFLKSTIYKGQVAQMVRAFGLHPKGRGFNSFLAHHSSSHQNFRLGASKERFLRSEL